MKTKNALLRIALLVFFTLSVTACSTPNTIQQNETGEISSLTPSDTPTPKPTKTLQPTVSPTPNTTWRVLAFKKAEVYLLAMDPIDPHILYAGVIHHEEDLLLKSMDGGESWSVLNQYPEIPYNWHFRALAINPDNPDILYAAIYDQGMFKSEDGGDTWQSINSGLIDYTFGHLIISPSTPDTLYLSSNYGLFSTSDGGAHWKLVNSGLPYEPIKALAIDPRNSARVYIGTERGFYKSIDFGETWTASNSGLVIQVGDMHEPAPTWVHSIVVHPHDPDILYLGGSGVFKSTNGGRSWKAMQEGMDYFGNGVAPSIEHLSIDPSIPKNVYAVYWNTTVYQSKNNAENWALFEEGLFTDWWEGTNTPVLIDHTDSNILYVGSRDHGLYTTRLEILPTTTPTTTPDDCTSGWTQLKVNTYAKVSGDEGDLPNRVRAEADTQSDVIYQLYPGEVVKLVEGPLCIENLVFWKVEHNSIPGGSGWTAEGDLVDYWLLPYKTE